MTELVLWFAKSAASEHAAAPFFVNSSGLEIIAVEEKGKTGGAYRNAGSFPMDSRR